MKIFFISWSRYHSRTERMAKALGAEVRYVWRLGRAPLPLLPIKYLLQFLGTCALLIRERPDIVIAQTPPVFLALLSWIYSSLTGARFIIDAHSGSFLSRKWKWSYPLHRWCSRRALVTIAHVGTLERLLRLSNIRVMNIGYVGDGLPQSVPYPLPNAFNVVVPSSFKNDEPVEAIILAARLLPDVKFFITGDPSKLQTEIRVSKPDNVVFTSYLSTAQYFGLLESSDAVLVLTKQDHTFQCGAEEAILLGRPVVTSKTRSLQDALHRGVVFVENSPQDIASGIRFARNHSHWLGDQVHILKTELDQEWERNRLQLQSIMHNSSENHPDKLPAPAEVRTPYYNRSNTNER